MTQAITLTTDLLESFRGRRAAGESVKVLARELPGVCWQKLEKALRHGPRKPQRASSAASTKSAVLPTPSVKAGPLTEMYRPQSLDSIFGQPEVVTFLRGLVGKPHPAALLFEGETGTGKTSAALALANDLGCRVDQKEFGGVHVIAAGEQTADAVRETYNRLWQTPFYGSGWKVLIVNEADRMHAAVETVWLDRLENLPPRTMIVFTTNYLDKLSQRLRDRCLSLHFECDPRKVADDARALLTAMWRAEARRVPARQTIDQVVAAATQDGKFSFRRAVQLLHPYLMAQTTRGGAK